MSTSFLYDQWEINDYFYHVCIRISIATADADLQKKTLRVFLNKFLNCPTVWIIRWCKGNEFNYFCKLFKSSKYKCKLWQRSPDYEQLRSKSVGTMTGTLLTYEFLVIVVFGGCNFHWQLSSVPQPVGNSDLLNRHKKSPNPINSIAVALEHNILM